ncbi:hypothetical protein [Paraburkholderia sp.]|uniref:hypothetical protein n=1 Tax=Paraburkholderia sp. TaxID=1926495 RepID=UPI002395B37E|nr:hypothetical protein [Paraburkholderia sp.]MDE1179261.1 hypothetical protein [Paraburkholderia sp.]
MSHPMSVEIINQYGTPSVRVGIEQHSVLLAADDVDRLIEHLAAVRASMRPEVPAVPSRTHQYLMEVDPCWHSEKHPLYEGAVLLFRHAGFGWTGFALPTPSLVRLKDALSAHLDALHEAPGLPN